MLVDGGASAEQIARHVRQETDDLDVLVCTHNDADHANGVVGLLESKLPCKEVWLPGQWTNRLADLLSNSPAFAEEIYDDWEDVRDKVQLQSLEKVNHTSLTEYSQHSDDSETDRMNTSILQSMKPHRGKPSRLGLDSCSAGAVYHQSVVSLRAPQAAGN